MPAATVTSKAPHPIAELRAELEGLAPRLAELEEMAHAPRLLAAAQARASMIELRIRRLEREAVAEQHDPRWRAKLEEAIVERDAAVADHARLRSQRIAAAKRSQAGAELAPSESSLVVGGAIRGGAIRGTMLLGSPSPQLQAAEMRMRRANRRLLELRSYPDRLAASPESQVRVFPPRRRRHDEHDEPEQRTDRALTPFGRRVRTAMTARRPE